MLYIYIVYLYTYAPPGNEHHIPPNGKLGKSSTQQGYVSSGGGGYIYVY